MDNRNDDAEIINSFTVPTPREAFESQPLPDEVEASERIVEAEGSNSELMDGLMEEDGIGEDWDEDDDEDSDEEGEDAKGVAAASQGAGPPAQSNSGANAHANTNSNANVNSANAKNNANANAKKAFRPPLPLPPWLVQYLDTIYSSLRASVAAKGKPTCYLDGTLWARAPDPIFMLQTAGHDPSKLWRPDVFVWAPHYLVNSPIACPTDGCNSNLNYHSWIARPRDDRV